MKKTLLSLILLVSVLCPLVTRASHAQGADLTYKFVSYNSSTGVSKYYVIATFYRDCSGIPADPTMLLNITNAACSGGSYATTQTIPLLNGLPCPGGGTSTASGGCDVSHLCPIAMGMSTCSSGSGTLPGMQKYVYADTVQLPGNGVSTNLCAQWTISISISARNPCSNLTGNGNLYIEAVINNTTDPNTGQPYHNSSPDFQNDPVPFVCNSSSVLQDYNNAGVDTDGDSLVYSLVNPLQGPNSPCTFTSGYSASCPITSGVQCMFDSHLGILRFRPTQTEVDDIAFLVQEYRHGILVGSTRRDVQIKILNCSAVPPAFATSPHIVQGGVLIDSVTVTGCPGDHLILDIPITSASSTSLTLQSSIDQFPASFPGMTFAQIGTGGNLTGRIEWSSIDTVCRYVYVRAESNDCPVVSYSFNAIRICGSRKISITPQSGVYCGQPIVLTGSGGLNPVWTPSASISSVNTLVTSVYPTVSTWYHLGTSCGTDSVLIRVGPHISATISHDTSVCNGYPVQLHANATGPGLYHYTWTPSLGLYDPITGLPNSAISNPVVKTGTTTLYHCEIADTTGCAITDSVQVSVSGQGRLTLTADSLVNAGALAHLSAALTPYYAGATTLADSMVTETSYLQVGTNTTNQAGSGFIYPSPFGNYSKSARHQMLFHASELAGLIDSGSTSAIISSVALNIGILNNGATLTNFTVKIGSVHVDSLTQFEGANSLLTVVDNITYTPVLGWNTLTFQNAYVWDGVSDIVVDICFSNTTSGNINSKLKYTPTSFRSYWFSNGLYPMCGVTGSQTIAGTYASYYQRPNVRFGKATLTGSIPGLQWQPSSGVNAVSNSAALSTTAIVHSDQWYTLSIAGSACPQTDSVLVRVNVSGVHPAQDTAICAGDSVLLIAYNGTSYSWSDQTGILSTSPYFYYAPAHSSDVILTMVSSAGTYTDTTHITVLEQQVWPGDVNDDHVVDNNDILYLGIAYGNTGPVRPNASLIWSGQCAPTWDSTFANGANYTHADCNGDGIVGYDDTLALSNNYGQVHAKTSAGRQSNYSLTVTTDKALYYQHDTIRASISAGDISTPIQGIYGLAYDFYYASQGAAHIISVDQSMSWLDRKLDFKKTTVPDLIYLAQSRVNHKDTSGYGKIAEIRLVVDYAMSTSDSAYLTVGSALALNKNGDTVFVNSAAKTVAVSNAILGISDINNEGAIEIYPNPNSGVFSVILSSAEKTNLTVVDAIGRDVYAKALSEKTTNIDLHSLPDGMYIASFSSASGKSSKRIVIAR
jgi:hypothetical protein